MERIVQERIIYVANMCLLCYYIKNEQIFENEHSVFDVLGFGEIV